MMADEMGISVCAIASVREPIPPFRFKPADRAVSSVCLSRVPRQSQPRVRDFVHRHGSFCRAPLCAIFRSASTSGHRAAGFLFVWGEFGQGGGVADSG